MNKRRMMAKAKIRHASFIVDPLLFSSAFSNVS